MLASVNGECVAALTGYAPGTRRARVGFDFLTFGASEKWPRFGVNSPQRALFPAHRIESLEDCAGHTGTVRFFGLAVHQSQQWTHGANNSRLT